MQTPLGELYEVLDLVLRPFALKAVDSQDGFIGIFIFC